MHPAKKEELHAKKDLEAIGLFSYNKHLCISKYKAVELLREQFFFYNQTDKLNQSELALESPRLDHKPE